MSHTGKPFFFNSEKNKNENKNTRRPEVYINKYLIPKVSDPKRHVNKKRPKHAPSHTPCNHLCGLVLPFHSRADLAISYAILPFTQSINKNTFIQKERETKIKIQIRKQTKRQSKGPHHPCNFNPIFLHKTKL